MKTVQHGFTLIELMIVVAIVGILAAIALPAYQNYTIRAQVSEGTSVMSGMQTAVAEYYANNGTWSSTNAQVGITKVISGTNVTDVSLINPGQVKITYGNNANANIAGKTVIWTAFTSANGDVGWVCEKHALTGTANLASPEQQGTVYAVNPAYLPSFCD